MPILFGLLFKNPNLRLPKITLEIQLHKSPLIQREMFAQIPSLGELNPVIQTESLMRSSEKICADFNKLLIRSKEFWN